MQVGDKVKIGRGCQWEQIAPVVKVGKAFRNGQTQVWVRMSGGKQRCFHLDETNIQQSDPTRS